MSPSAPTILMVEDNETNHPLFEAAFTAAGFKTILCQNADGPFVEDVVALQPDIISMDLMIGKSGVEIERDGFHALALLKSDERTKHIPVIILTSFFAEDKVQKAKELGAVDFVTIQGHAISTIPAIFTRYLDNPKQYKPVSPLFSS